MQALNITDVSALARYGVKGPQAEIGRAHV